MIQIVEVLNFLKHLDRFSNFVIWWSLRTDAYWFWTVFDESLAGVSLNLYDQI